MILKSDLYVLFCHHIDGKKSSFFLIFLCHFIKFISKTSFHAILSNLKFMNYNSFLSLRQLPQKQTCSTFIYFFAVEKYKSQSFGGVKNDDYNSFR